MPKIDPSQPLANKRHELFAHRYARSGSYGDSWKATIPFGQEYKGGSNSLRVTGFRVGQRPEVAARVEFIRQAAKKITQTADEPLSPGDIVRLNLEVSEALEVAYKAAETAHISPQKLEALRRVLAAHLARQGKLNQPDALDIKPSETAVMVSTAMENMAKVCGCPT